MSILLIFITFFAVGTSAWQFWLRRQSDQRFADAKKQNEVRERKMQTILQNAPIVFSAIDTNGIFHISEGKGLEKLGRKNNQSVGVSIYEMHKKNPAILDAVKRALSGEHIATSFVLNEISYDLFIGPEKNDRGDVTGVSMLSVDITDRIRMEKEKSALLIREKSAIETSKLKSEFMATLSHEIRTPLNGVIGMADLLSATPLTVEQKEFVDSIRISGAGLLCVINDILDFSKIEAGKLELEEINFDLPTFTTHVAKGLGATARVKHIQFHTELDEKLPCWVKGDPNRYRQVLNNLIGNAIKFTESGSVVVRLFRSAQAAEAESCRIRVEVEDSGVGISSEVQSKIFLPFSQGEASMSRRFGGTGLGLSISKKLVEKMGGEIGFSSQQNQGTTFWFEIPFRLGVAPTIETKLEQISLQSVAPILIAEDNVVNQKIAVKMLKKMGLEAHVVNDGVEAREALKKYPFDLVLMDCQMPNLDGLAATQKFRAENSTLNQNIPIIAMTANAMKGDREKCIAVGMNDYISKPVSYEVLNEMVSRWLALRKRA